MSEPARLILPGLPASSLAAIGYHFSSKEALLTEALLLAFWRMGPEFRAALNATVPEQHGPVEQFELIWARLIREPSRPTGPFGWPTSNYFRRWTVSLRSAGYWETTFSSPVQVLAALFEDGRELRRWHGWHTLGTGFIMCS